jgi:hypothetical protein
MIKPAESLFIGGLDRGRGSDQILLLAVGVVVAHDRSRPHPLSWNVGEVEEIANCIGQSQMTLGGADSLAQNVEPIGQLGPARLELGLAEVLLLEGLIPKAKLRGDGRLEVLALTWERRASSGENTQSAMAGTMEPANAPRGMPRELPCRFSAGDEAQELVRTRRSSLNPAIAEDALWKINHDDSGFHPGLPFLVRAAEV